MIDTKLLRQKILDLAIRGKLVPQDPNDEPASELLKRIKAEKEALIKAGKIKRDKHESYIFRGEDKRYYEQIDGKTVDITEEIPFALPDSWTWVRLGSIGTWKAGATPSRRDRSYYEGGTIPWLKTGDLNDGYITDIPEFITKKAVAETSVQLNPVGSVLIAMYGATIGKLGILQIEATTNQACCACQTFSCVDNLYLFGFLLSQRENFTSLGTGGAQPNISKDIIVNYLFPLPPLNEQKRIVSQVESLLKYIDGIDENAASLENTISLAKQKILDLAIRGKLVPQDPNEEPASELLKKFKAEKEALIKSEKLKRDKHESFIFRGDDNCYHENVNGKSVDVTDKIPFELPKSWEWCKIGNIGILNPKNHLDDNVLVSFMPMAQLEGGYGSKYELSEKLWKDVKKGFTHFGEKDIVLAKITPCFQNRKSAIMSGLKNGFGAGTTELHVIRCFSAIFPEYVLMFLKNKRFISDAASTIQGVVGQQRVDGVFIKDYLIPLPPFAEQKRIVSQIEKMFSILETMHG